jgi:DNA-binding protein H-NS
MDERKRDSMVAYLRRRMTEFGITPEVVAASIAADHASLRAVKYRDAFGSTWDGKGAAPQWVIQATSAGQNLEHFSVHQSDAPAADRRTAVDWQNDPFAGSRLATIKSEHRNVA